MDGFVLLDKPSGLTSSQAAVEVMHALGARKAGHSGTLDPMATGVLLVGLDGSVKSLGRLMGLDKKYEGMIKLHADVPAGRIVEASKAFIGSVRQVPPKKSAVARKERERQVYAFAIKSISGREACFSLHCESGFYVRKLAHDLGISLGVGAQLRELRRVSVGPFIISECSSMDELKKGSKNVIPDAVIMSRVRAHKVSL